jgi:hypothetical protein
MLQPWADFFCAFSAAKVRPATQLAPIPELRVKTLRLGVFAFNRILSATFSSGEIHVLFAPDLLL